MKPITSGQKEQIVNFTKDAARKAAEEAVEEMAANGALNGDNAQRVIGSRRFTADIRDFVKQKLDETAELITNFVKLISGDETLSLDPTDGTRTIAEAGKVFTWSIDSDFKNRGLNVKAAPTKGVKVQVHEMVEDGTFTQIFASFSDDLDKLVFTQHQVTNFVEKHKLWLRADGNGTFFLLKRSDEFFVARVRQRVGGRLRIEVFHLLGAGVWEAKGHHWFVVPQRPPPKLH